MMKQENEADEFAKARPRLMGLAYRFLGSISDAEDAVQDTYLKWNTANQHEIRNAGAWLAKVCSHRCLDILKSAHKARVSYVGMWLPEPVFTRLDDATEDQVALASSLNTAFLLLLERLTPKERAAYLLHDIFGHSYEEIAEILQASEVACRKLVSRARPHVGSCHNRYLVHEDRQQQLLDAFQTAITAGEVAQLENLLAEDIILSADSGGKVVAVRKPVKNKSAVISFIGEILFGAWQHSHMVFSELNGQKAILMCDDNKVTAAVSFQYGARNLVQGIYIMRNPEKLARLARHELLLH